MAPSQNAANKLKCLPADIDVVRRGGDLFCLKTVFINNSPETRLFVFDSFNCSSLTFGMQDGKRKHAVFFRHETKKKKNFNT